MELSDSASYPRSRIRLRFGNRISRLRFDSDEDAAEGEEVGMEVEDTPEAKGEEAVAEVIDSDQTSADYYYDSYSHFGTGHSIFQRRPIFVSPLQSCVHRKNRILHV
jgi:hypothetical protein